MIFFRSFQEAAALLSDNERLQFYDAIIGYGLDGVEPSNLSDTPRALYFLSKPNIDASNQRQSAGSMGGRPRTKGLPCTREEFIALDDIPRAWVKKYEFPKSWREARISRMARVE